MLDISQFVTPEGGYHESMDYQRITFLPMALLAELRRTTSGDDPARRFGAYWHYGDTYLYKTLPDGTTSRRGDHEWPYFLEQDNDVLGYIVNRFKDPQTYSTNVFGGGGTNGAPISGPELAALSGLAGSPEPTPLLNRIVGAIAFNIVLGGISAWLSGWIASRRRPSTR